MKYVFIKNEPDLPKALKYYSPIRYIGGIVSPYKNNVLVEQYLSFAKKDIEEKKARNKVNALSNIKRAIHLHVDLILNQCGLFHYAKKLNFPKKTELLKQVNVAPSLILNKINIERNLLEHSYKVPSIKMVEESLDIAELFIMATEKYFLKFCIEIRVGFTNNKNDYLFKLNSINSKIEKYNIIGADSKRIDNIEVFSGHIFSFGKEGKLFPGIKLKLLKEFTINKENFKKLLPIIRLFVYETKNSEITHKDNIFSVTTYFSDAGKLSNHLEGFFKKSMLKKIKNKPIENKKLYCKSLYDRYYKLKARTKMEVGDIGEKGKLDANIRHIDPKDMREKIRAEKELRECLEFLSDSQLEMFSRDEELTKSNFALTRTAMKILVKRKLKNKK